MRILLVIGAAAIVALMALSSSAFAAQSCEDICVAFCAKNSAYGAGLCQPRCIRSCYQKRSGMK
jgi:hypothetical protein